MYHFEADHMDNGTQLAVLDNNNNTGRIQKRTIASSSKLRLSIKNHYRVAYRKPSKKFIARVCYERKRYNYLREMLKEVQERGIQGVKSTVPTKKKVMAPLDRKNKFEMIQDCVKYKRFKY